jgi:uncharacterized membrane protein YfcA
VPADVLVTVPLGLGLGFVIGLTGVGGGALVAPALYVVLDLAYPDAVALSLIYSFFTKVAAALQHLRQGTVLWKVTLVYGLTGIPGAILGSHLVYRVGPAAQRVFPFVMGAVLAVVALLILAEAAVRNMAAWEKPFSPRAITMPGALAIALFQLVVGTLLGVTSVGSGSLVVLSMLYLFRMTAAEIVGSNIVIALIMVVPAALTHYASAGVSWPVLALLVGGALVGAPLGARATLLLPNRALKLTIALLVMAAALATVVKTWGTAAG